MTRSSNYLTYCLQSSFQLIHRKDLGIQLNVEFRIEEKKLRRVSSLHILHFHLADRPESIHLLDVRGNHLTMEFAELVIELDLGDDIAILADPDELLGENFAILLGCGFDNVVIKTVCRFFAQEAVDAIKKANTSVNTTRIERRFWMTLSFFILFLLLNKKHI